MGTPVIQKSFNSGEWAPQLYSRVDMEKYKSGLALALNWFIDYRGGASTRMGTQYINQAYVSNKTVRIISYRASTTVSYVLELGDFYIRFFYNKAPVLEGTIGVTGASNANPCVLTVTNSYTIGDWVFVAGVTGMTQLNGNYYIITASTPTTITLANLNGAPVDATAFGVYSGGGTVARVYTITSPYSASEVNQINFAQSVDKMILCHPNHSPYSLAVVTYNNWTLAAIAFGTTAAQPSINSSASTLALGQVNYSYVVTSVTAAGDESIASGPAGILSRVDMQTTAGSNSLTVSAVGGAASYNWYKSTVSYFGLVPPGIPYGYIGNTLSTTIIDSNISPDFSQTPPVNQNPFQGISITSITQLSPGSYTSVPAVSFSGGSPSINAVANAVLVAQTVAVAVSGTGFATGQFIYLANNVILSVVAYGGGTLFVSLVSGGAIVSGSVPVNPVPMIYSNGGGSGAFFNLTWGVGQTQLISGGEYATPPSIVYSPAGATAAITTTTNPIINPTVPGFYQQRMLLSGGNQSPETLAFSQPGSYFNFNTSNPIQPDDALDVTLASGQLEQINALVPTAAGLIVFTDQSSWMVNGGGLGTAITPSTVVANRQSYNGAAPNIQPIVSNFDILYVEAKGSAVRDASYNYYAQIFTGQDISVVSSHLFFGYQITQWTWAQSPFKAVWAVRNDGVLLSLTFAKEEEFIAWSHHNTQGLFNSVTSVPETATNGMILDATYVVVQRTINGVTTQYIERFADRIFNNQVKNAWCVDAGIQYNGSPTMAFSGAQQLAGAVVTGLADGVVIPPFTMPVSGSFTLSAPASLVTVGLAFTPQLQTLPIETGEPTTQGKQKKINSVVVRCVDTLGLSIGSSFSNLISMQDLVVGNVGSMTNTIVTDLVTGDAMAYVDPLWASAGQFCIQQSNPMPATVTGVIPRLTVGG